jgi:4-hydroxy-2-oxoheptanedioate aldolase
MREATSLKKRLKQGDIVFGPWCVIPSSSLMNIIAASGFDFVIIDMEHGPISFETAEEMTRAAQSIGCNSIIRLNQVNEEYILKSLDIGADGVLVAHVEKDEDAYKTVSFSKYYPAGSRGFSPYTRAGGYSGENIMDHANRQNEKTFVGVILEGREGIDNIEAILETENLDLVYVGAYDLSQALGMPGDVDHPKVKKYMERCIRQITDAGIAAGGYVAKSKDDIAWMIDIGMQFVTYLPDCTVLYRALEKAVKEFHSMIR